MISSFPLIVHAALQSHLRVLESSQLSSAPRAVKCDAFRSRSSNTAPEEDFRSWVPRMLIRSIDPRLYLDSGKSRSWESTARLHKSRPRAFDCTAERSLKLEPGNTERGSQRVQGATRESCCISPLCRELHPMTTLISGLGPLRLIQRRQPLSARNSTNVESLREILRKISRSHLSSLTDPNSVALQVT